MESISLMVVYLLIFSFDYSPVRFHNWDTQEGKQEKAKDRNFTEENR